MLTNYARERKSHASEQGFTLPELMIVVVLMGILAAIAIPSWFGLVASKNATAAANQVAADMRLAHSTSTNRLTDWRFSTTGGASYQTGPAGSLKTRTLPNNATVASGVAMDFKASGDVRKTDGSLFTSSPIITIKDSRGNPAYRIEINTQTSRVRVDPV